jgi:hypothetical protein
VRKKRYKSEGKRLIRPMKKSDGKRLDLEKRKVTKNEINCLKEKK